MTDPATALLVVFLILLTKHFICDYPLQTAYQLNNKGTYGHPGGILHAGIHILGTVPVFFVMTPTLGIGAAILIGEFVVHYNVDWAKQQMIARMGMTADKWSFWFALGLDQFLHNLTYVAIAAVLLWTTT